MIRGLVGVIATQQVSTSAAVYGYAAGGWVGSRSNAIQYFNTSSTTGNATDGGDLTVARNTDGAAGNGIAFFGGGVT